MAQLFPFEISPGFTAKIKSKKREIKVKIVISLAFPLGLLCGVFPQNPTDASPSPTCVVADCSTVSNPFLDNLYSTGMVFPDSSVRLLTQEEIADISGGTSYTKYEMYCFAINEVYARKGYSFSSAPYYERFYSSFSWYPQNHSLTMEQARSQFNSFEQVNVDALAIARDKN